MISVTKCTGDDKCGCRICARAKRTRWSSETRQWVNQVERSPAPQFELLQGECVVRDCDITAPPADVFRECTVKQSHSYIMERLVIEQRHDADCRLGSVEKPPAEEQLE